MIAAVTLTVLRARRVIALKDVNALARREPMSAMWPFWLGAGFAIYAAVIVGAGLGAAIVNRSGWAPESLPAEAAATWGAYLMALIAVGVLLIARRRTMREAGFRISWHDAWIGVGAYLLVFPIVTVTLLAAGAVADVVRGGPSDPISHELLSKLAAGDRTAAWWAMVVAVVIVAPIVEEVIYRGCLQTAVRAAGGTPVVAILTTAVVFAAAHATAVRPEALPGLFVLGVGFGLVFERTGRLGAPIVMHAAFNAANIAQAMLP